jgi:hypothetical protein
MLFTPLSISFIGTTCLAIYLFARAHDRPGRLAAVLLTYASLQFGIAATGLYENVDVLPPRFLLNIVPAIAAVLWLMLSKSGKAFAAGFDQSKLLWVHVVRIPVEVVLYGLFIAGLVPRIMTFAGQNFDIVAGITAPIIWHLFYRSKSLSPALLKAWHWLMLALLGNIVVTALLAAPLPFQQIAFDQPNVGVLIAPFNLLPAVVVPLVIVGHLLGLREKG